MNNLKSKYEYVMEEKMWLVPSYIIISDEHLFKDSLWKLYWNSNGTTQAFVSI